MGFRCVHCASPQTAFPCSECKKTGMPAEASWQSVRCPWASVCALERSWWKLPQTTKDFDTGYHVSIRFSFQLFGWFELMFITYLFEVMSEAERFLYCPFITWNVPFPNLKKHVYHIPNIPKQKNPCRKIRCSVDFAYMFLLFCSAIGFSFSFLNCLGRLASEVAVSGTELDSVFGLVNALGRLLVCLPLDYTRFLAEKKTTGEFKFLLEAFDWKKWEDLKFWCWDWLCSMCS